MIAQALVVPRHKTRPVVRMVTVMVGLTLVMISPTKEHSGQMQIAMDSVTTREESTLIRVPQWLEPQVPTDMGVLIQTQIHGLILMEAGLQYRVLTLVLRHGATPHLTEMAALMVMEMVNLT